MEQTPPGEKAGGSFHQGDGTERDHDWTQPEKYFGGHFRDAPEVPEDGAGKYDHHNPADHIQRRVRDPENRKHTNMLLHTGSADNPYPSR
jgi:hypothetical protein